MNHMSLCPVVSGMDSVPAPDSDTREGPMKWRSTKIMNDANQTLILSEYGFRKSGENKQEIAEVVKEEALQCSLVGDGTGWAQRLF